MQSRNQTMRLNELKMLKKRLDESRTETKSYEKSIKRLDTVFIELERLIEQDSSAHSESLLSRFSKHLRHLLHEGASHSISVEENLEYLEGGLALMSAMNQHSWAFEINNSGIAPIDINRKVKSLQLSSWMFDTLWDTILKDSIETSVDLILSSDTYELRAILRFNQREISTRLELLG